MSVFSFCLLSAWNILDLISYRSLFLQIPHSLGLQYDTHDTELASETTGPIKKKGVMKLPQKHLWEKYMAADILKKDVETSIIVSNK